MKKLVALVLAVGLLLTCVSALAEVPKIGDSEILFAKEVNGEKTNTWSSKTEHSKTQELVEFSLSDDALVRASIYNSDTGEFYVGVADGEYQAGKVTLYWNGVNSKGWHAPRGQEVNLVIRVYASNENGSTKADIPLDFVSGHNMEDHEEIFIPPIITDIIPEEYRPENVPFEFDPEEPIIDYQWYAHNNICVGGLEFRQEKPEVTNKWYNFAPIDLSVQGEQVFELVASNMYVIGSVVVTVDGDDVTVEWKLNKQGTTDANFQNESEFLTFFHNIDEVTSVEPKDIETSFEFGEPISIANDLGGDTNVLLYIRNVATYCTNLSYQYQQPIFHFNFDRNIPFRVAYQEEMRALMELE